ncbi:hypothetical protein NE237_024998 [Protea cynaroides]|uniref:Uncharacterized protein n=1 Tax=Protea cynaroides TaxID=273540 RepID=A0A9Q0K050_9MAGN|nr:hypothetical protein NE237_024998 [Protea cynaroides]
MVRPSDWDSENHHEGGYVALVLSFDSSLILVLQFEGRSFLCNYAEQVFMTRRCSHCSHNGHNSRTCPTRGGVKLFGVRLTDGSIKKSASMGNLSSAHYCSSSSAAASPNPSSPSDPLRDPIPVAEGYVSDDPAASCSSNCRGEKKKGIPWTEEEHRLFLIGLQKLGKGDWRGIARNFVISRTPTQVASHAQKYFIRQSNAPRRKRRSSLFDMMPDMSMESTTMTEEHILRPTSPAGETENVEPQLPLDLSLNHECEPMAVTSNETHTEAEETVTSTNFPPMMPGFFPTYLPVPFPFWPPSTTPAGEEKQGKISQHQVLKPTPIHSKDPVNVDQLVSMSMLSLGEAAKGRLEPSPLSQKLAGAPSRQSAFHAKPPVSYDTPELHRINGYKMKDKTTEILHFRSSVFQFALIDKNPTISALPVQRQHFRRYHSLVSVFVEHILSFGILPKV